MTENQIWEEKYNELLLRYDSLVSAVKKLEGNYQKLVEENEFYKEQLINCELNLSQQKTNLINVVTTSNQVKDDMAQEIADLRNELKGMRDGDKH